MGAEESNMYASNPSSGKEPVPGEGNRNTASLSTRTQRQPIQARPSKRDMKIFALIEDDDVEGIVSLLQTYQVVLEGSGSNSGNNNNNNDNGSGEGYMSDKTASPPPTEIPSPLLTAAVNNSSTSNNNNYDNSNNARRKADAPLPTNSNSSIPVVELPIHLIRDKSGGTILHIAARFGSMQILKICLRNELKAYEARLATEKQQMKDGVTTTVKNPFDVEIKPHWKIFVDQAQGFDLEAQENGWGSTPLHSTARAGQDFAVQLLINAGAQIQPKDDYGFIPLSRAAYEGHLSTCAILIRHGSNVFDRDNVLQQPIHRAASRGHAEVCRLLVKAGADLDTFDQMRQTPLMTASFFGHEETCFVLLHLGANTELECPSNGATALFSAVRGEHAAIVKVLLDFQCNVNHQDFNGVTPLHIAVHKRYHKIAGLLLLAGADFDMVDKRGLTPWDEATKIGGDERLMLVFEETLGADVVRRRRIHEASSLTPESLLHRQIDIFGLGRCFVLSCRYVGVKPFGETLHLVRFSNGDERQVMLLRGNNQGLPFVISIEQQQVSDQ